MSNSAVTTTAAATANGIRIISVPGETELHTRQKSRVLIAGVAGKTFTGNGRGDATISITSGAMSAATVTLAVTDIFYCPARVSCRIFRASSAGKFNVEDLAFSFFHITKSSERT